MPEIFVEKLAEFAEGDRRIVFHDELEIGVFHWQGRFYAYQNLCLHQGGPCCEGVIMHKVEDVLAPDRTWLGQTFSEQEAHFVCPWHGYEYDIRTGECVGNRKLRLKAYDVVQRAESDKEFLAEAAKAGLEVRPVSGANVQKLVADIYETPAATVQRTIQLLQ